VPTKAKAIQQAAIQEAAMQDAAVLAYETELRRIFRLLTKQLKTSLGRMQRDPDGRLTTSRQNLIRVFALRKDVRDELRRGGFDRVALSAVDDPLDKLAEAVLKHAGIANKAVTLTPLGLDAIAAFKELRLADLLDLADDVARTVQRAALDGVLGVRPADKLIHDVADALDVSLRQGRTIYDTAVSTFTRQIEQMASQGGDDELFFYVGPADSKVRPFCREHVGKVYSREQIDQMDNGQLGDVFISGGGYNCRHVFKRVSALDVELRELHKTGERAPWLRGVEGDAIGSDGAQKFTGFHGSAREFDKFSLDMSGSATDEGGLGKGLYFSTDARVIRPQDAFGYEVELSIKKPLMLDVPTDFMGQVNLLEAKKEIVAKALGIPGDSNAAAITSAAKAAGFDSVILDYSPMGYHQREIVVFSEKQVKIVKRNRKAS
jgi:hypothetical protein